MVVLNGAPRSGKSSIARAVQEQLPGVWMNLGTDLFIEATPPRLLAAAAQRLEGLPALLVGVFCPLEVVMARRDAGETGREGRYLGSVPGGVVPEPVRRWQQQVHLPGIYDLEIDTSTVRPHQAAAAIQERLAGPPPTAFRRLARER